MAVLAVGQASGETRTQHKAVGGAADPPLDVTHQMRETRLRGEMSE